MHYLAVCLMIPASITAPDCCHKKIIVAYSISIWTQYVKPKKEQKKKGSVQLHKKLSIKK
jgi:hypothetical protein